MRHLFIHELNPQASKAREGTDYEAAGGELTFGPGECEKEITVTVIDDKIPEEKYCAFEIELYDVKGALLFVSVFYFFLHLRVADYFHLTSSRFPSSFIHSPTLLLFFPLLLTHDLHRNTYLSK